MKKNEFNKRVKNIIGSVVKEMAGTRFEPVNTWLGERIVNPFQYGAISERCMERQLEELKGCERKTTFMSDFSVGEWFGVTGLFETIENAMTNWKDNVEMMSEFVLCVNWKSWEHYARENSQWSKLYALLYEGIRDLMYDYYEGDEEKTSYMWRYLD